MRHEQRILICDDNTENLRVVGSYLKSEGYSLAFARSADEMFKLTEDYNPDLILLDVMMPGMDGFEACRILKSNEKLREIPVIFLTAKIDIQDIVAGFNAGGVDYIAKPFNPSELIVRVNSHLELKKARETIAMQASELKKLNQTKDRIFSIISHDMRTPLASLRMLLNRIFEVDICEKKEFVLHSLKLMEMSATESYQLLDNLLYWSRSQMGSVKCSPVMFNMVDMVRSIIKLYQYPAAQKKLAVQFNPGSESLIFADEEMIKTVLRNLISNAMKFSFPGSTVAINISLGDEANILSISNQGPGIKAGFLEKIFEDHEYVTSLGTSGEKGTGLGLKICKYFVLLNGGKIWVTSQPGGSTVFFVSLPGKRVAS